MQAIQESNEHIAEVMQLLEQNKSTLDEESRMYIEVQLADIKANQALAFALLAVAQAIQLHD